MITIFIGDVYFETAKKATEYDQHAFLIDHKNVQVFLQDKRSSITAYTSLGDLSKDLKTILSVLDKAEKIIYVEPTKWSDNKTVNLNYPTESVQGLTEYILWRFYHNKKNVENINFEKYNHQNMLTLVDHRKSNDPNIWVLGSSFSTGGHGIDKNSYPWLLSQQLDLPLNLLAGNAMSIEWMADQIIRSNVQSGDIVILSLNLSDNKHCFWNDVDQSVNVLDSSWKETPANRKRVKQLGFNNIDLDRFLFYNDTGFYKTIIHIHQIINFCKLVKAKLFLFGIYTSDRLNLALADIPEFRNYTYKLESIGSGKVFVDYANDDKHPGVFQHKLYADFIIDNLSRLNYI
jgi:hypothetical protein